MSRNRGNWNRLFHVSVLIILTAPFVFAGDKPEISAAEIHPLSEVVHYLRARGTNTSLQDERAAKELIGKVYRGSVVVGDVKEGSKVIEIVDRDGPMYFWVENAALKEEAAQLRKSDKIEITARLKTTGNTVQTLFVDVQSLDVQPREQTEQKK
jgi:hypothetical protein